ncbi:uncharacterized protein E0L32_003044 [Thyridium curvatum]|uniref:Aminoacyl-transfer RNA synthetases class-II family profile domain-containing protein n=1 Tax=Thyridium curvatum TaxID=1093900 RepID=A0A507BK01_9PEZI|nr:uncharacterized protein E0L32_003044 [Thyridium curvatum]TPX17401.1 hypothetical protein E0L32_003044 [Thyridium curvatum]
MGARLRLGLLHLPCRLMLRSHHEAVRLQTTGARQLHADHRNRLSNVWIPAATVAAKDVKEDEESHSKLIRAGFLRQAHSGIYHMLPLGHRVQQKIEDLIDKHMRSVGMTIRNYKTCSRDLAKISSGASKLALSTISSEALWQRSGRLQSIGSELWRLSDRKKGKYLLGPTHEEEITNMVSQTVNSFKNLPIRLYQISPSSFPIPSASGNEFLTCSTARKYRDEARPRHGLLRSREFTMKDLYTFDTTTEAALATYEQIRSAYNNFFAELKVPILVAEASSGDMGGDLSHEYHIATSLGEDHVISCDSCDYVANAELAETRPVAQNEPLWPKPEVQGIRVWRGITKDRSTLVNVWYPASVTDSKGRTTRFDDDEVNIDAVKTLVPGLDAGIDDPLPLWQTVLDQVQNPSSSATDPSPRLLNLVDSRLPSFSAEQLAAQDTSADTPSLCPFPSTSSLAAALATLPSTTQTTTTEDSSPLNLLRIQPGDPCPKCDAGALNVQKAIELGHTFHLGTRYSEPLGAAVALPNNNSSKSPTTAPAPLQMGCHGIGVSRIIGAVADHLADGRGLNWPRTIAPYEVAVLAGHRLEGAAAQVYDALASAPGAAGDLVLDDRDSSLGWKMKDADLVGYPVVVVVGKSWSEAARMCEVQCRRLGVKETVAIDELPAYTKALLDQL